MENENASFEENPFDRLSDDILIDIFHRVADLKSLCLCSLVSKRFASLISHVRKVTITLSSDEMHPLDIDRIPGHCDHWIFVKKLKLPIFLEKFRKLESVYLDFKFPRRPDNSSSIMWKAKCGSSNSIIENLVALLPAVLKETEYEVDIEEQVIQDYDTVMYIKSQLVDCIQLSMGCYAGCLHLISMLIKSHSSLQSVTIADSWKQFKLVVKDEQLVNIRARLHEGEMERISVECSVKAAWVPLLHLPLSGYTMRGACLVMVNFPTESHASASGEYEEIMGWDFEEHENVFGEAVKKILTHHIDRIRVLQPIIIELCLNTVGMA